MPANLEKSAVATGLENVRFHSSPKDRQCQRMFKLPHKCTHLTRQQSNAQNSPSQVSTVHEPRTYRCSSCIQKKHRKQIKLPTCAGSLKKQENSRKASISASLTMLKPLTVWITTNCGKLFKRWEYQTTSPASREICMQVKKEQLEQDME